MQLFQAVRKRSGRSIAQFAQSLGLKRQHWHRLESELVQGKLLRTFARAVVAAGLTAEEVMGLLREAAGEPEAPPRPVRAGAPGTPGEPALRPGHR